MAGNQAKPDGVEAKERGAISTSTPLKGFTFSWVSVCVAEAITLPTDTVKTRMQLQGELGAARVYTSSINAAATIARTEGVTALWKGITPALLRQSVCECSALPCMRCTHPPTYPWSWSQSAVP
jgi:hypothetical protein